MPAAVGLLEQPERSFPQRPEDPNLDRKLAEAQARLAAHMLEMNDPGLLLDPAALRLLRTYATDALSIAITYRRGVGPCGYGCRHPGLHRRRTQRRRSRILTPQQSWSYQSSASSFGLG
jgi:hypothetical protein